MDAARDAARGMDDRTKKMLGAALCVVVGAAVVVNGYHAGSDGYMPARTAAVRRSRKLPG